MIVDPKFFLGHCKNSICALSSCDFTDLAIELGIESTVDTGQFRGSIGFFVIVGSVRQIAGIELQIAGQFQLPVHIGGEDIVVIRILTDLIDRDNGLCDCLCLQVGMVFGHFLPSVDRISEGLIRLCRGGYILARLFRAVIRSSIIVRNILCRNCIPAVLCRNILIGRTIRRDFIIRHFLCRHFVFRRLFCSSFLISGSCVLCRLSDLLSICGAPVGIFIKTVLRFRLRIIFIYNFLGISVFSGLSR